MTDRPLFLATAGDSSHVKEQGQNKTKRQHKKVDLADCYQEIGISAVVAAVQCQTGKNHDAMSASRQQKEDSNKRSANGPVKS